MQYAQLMHYSLMINKIFLFYYLRPFIFSYFCPIRKVIFFAVCIASCNVEEIAKPERLIQFQFYLVVCCIHFFESLLIVFIFLCNLLKEKEFQDIQFMWDALLLEE